LELSNLTSVFPKPLTVSGSVREKEKKKGKRNLRQKSLNCFPGPAKKMKNVGSNEKPSVFLAPLGTQQERELKKAGAKIAEWLALTLSLTGLRNLKGGGN